VLTAFNVAAAIMGVGQLPHRNRDRVLWSLRFWLLRCRRLVRTVHGQGERDWLARHVHAV